MSKNPSSTSGHGRGHGIILNMSSYAPFVFTFNPEKIETTKKINYSVAPNIGGAYKHRYFSGFDSKEVKFHIICIDMESPIGVMDEIAYFEQLREPDPGFLGGWLGGYGVQNYPPPQVLFQFGVSFVPLVWDVLDIAIEADHFHSGHVRGVLGIAKRCDITLSLSLVEDHILNKANQIAKKAEMLAGSAESLAREVIHKLKNTRKEAPGILKPLSRRW
jgi:hypothetical protein